MQQSPPLHLILTVEAVARLGSFRAAAEELLVTPSAVSHRVRNLEATLGHRLFDRVGQGIRATEHALRLAAIVGRAKGEIDRAWREIQADATQANVRVSCLAAFAGNYVLDDMADFRRRFPQFELNLATAFFKGTPREQLNDVVISCGPDPGPDWMTQPLQSLEMQAVAAPTPASPFIVDGKLKGPLLTYGGDTTNWPQIARLIGLALHEEAMFITLDSVEAACTAAERGVGVALAPVETARRLAQTGRVELLGRPIRSGLIYWMAVKRDLRSSPSIARFRQWLVARLGDDDQLRRPSSPA